MKITKREIIASVSIVAILISIGLVISTNIIAKQTDRNDKYNKAIHIDNDKDLFEYGMSTNVGNAFVYGELKVVDPVTYKGEVNGKYWYIEKVTERYTEHSYTTTDDDGDTTVHYYWTWDPVDSEQKCCKYISFLGHKFKQHKIDRPMDKYIDTVKGGYHIRYVYYGVGEKFTGTIFTKLCDNTILDKSPFYKSTIDETQKDLTSFNWAILFWIFWILLIIMSVYGFYYLDNNWLEK